MRSPLSVFRVPRQETGTGTPPCLPYDRRPHSNHLGSDLSKDCGCYCEGRFWPALLLQTLGGFVAPAGVAKDGALQFFINCHSWFDERGQRLSREFFSIVAILR